MTEFLLVRHGETDWNAEGRLQGHTDRPLSDYGRKQARRLADELAGSDIDAIYASDLARARETAEIVGARLHLPVVLEPDLREKDWRATRSECSPRSAESPRRIRTAESSS